jgi:hypothetical protein
MVKAKRTSKHKTRAKFTVPAPIRKIVKRNERQGRRKYDILVCKHAVLVRKDEETNTYRRFRRCPACRVKVQMLKDQNSIRPPSLPKKGAVIVPLRTVS